MLPAPIENGKSIWTGIQRVMLDSRRIQIALVKWATPCCQAVDQGGCTARSWPNETTYSFCDRQTASSMEQVSLWVLYHANSPIDFCIYALARLKVTPSVRRRLNQPALSKVEHKLQPRAFCRTSGAGQVARPKIGDLLPYCSLAMWGGKA